MDGRLAPGLVHPKLQQIQANDPALTRLEISRIPTCYYPRSDAEWAEAGHSIARNTHIRVLYISTSGDHTGLPPISPENLARLCVGLNENRCIRELFISGCIYSGEVLRCLTSFFQQNVGLTTLAIEDNDDRRGLSPAAMNSIIYTLQNNIGGSLKRINLSSNVIDDAKLRRLVAALRPHSVSLEEIDVLNNCIEDTGCTYLSNLLSKEASPRFGLKRLVMPLNFIHDEGAITLATAVAHNDTTEELQLSCEEFTKATWDAFSSVLCRSGSINDTFLSNHTLKKIIDYSQDEFYEEPFPWDYDPRKHDMNAYLQINQIANKSHVAMHKILLQHPDMDMKPLFERGLELLPYVVEWFEKVKDMPTETVIDERINLEDERVVVWDVEIGTGNLYNRKLSAIFKFAKSMPLLFVPGNASSQGTKKQRIK